MLTRHYQLLGAQNSETVFVVVRITHKNRLKMGNTNPGCPQHSGYQLTEYAERFLCQNKIRMTIKREKARNAFLTSSRAYV